MNEKYTYCKMYNGRVEQYIAKSTQGRLVINYSSLLYLVIRIRFMLNAQMSAVSNLNTDRPRWLIRIDWGLYPGDSNTGRAGYLSSWLYIYIIPNRSKAWSLQCCLWYREVIQNKSRV